MGILPIVHSNNITKDDSDGQSEDWRNLKSLPREVVSKQELDALQKEVISELEILQKEAQQQANDNSTAAPQTLFYYHKYIDAKFNKTNFDVDSYFVRKQNIIDQKYAEGLGQLKSEFTGYEELIDEIREVEGRLRHKIRKLDPNSGTSLKNFGTFDDSQQLLEQIDTLPEEINWSKLEDK